MKELKDARVYLFGSFVEGRHLPSSDIDVLIVSKNMPKKVSERSKIKAKIWKKIGLFSPFELHLVNEEEFEWYKRFVKKLVAV
jgi:predicted nucleotidyltransferase